MNIGNSSRASYCRSCGETFAGVLAFDAHRVNGKCVQPVEVGLLLDDADRWKFVRHTNADEAGPQNTSKYRFTEDDYPGKDGIEWSEADRIAWTESQR